ncbi:MAG TPA: thiamine diphosphokinase [Candidatus Thermoplasmatota archaeon]|nr:thiamine diphosphokinase [Candidatus Thermoplasmatota archaeon]
MAVALVFPRASRAVLREAPPGARLVAVDGGADAAYDAGLRPDVVVGDMDSVRPATLARCEAEGVPLRRHPARKRDSDAKLALAEARPDEEIVFLGPGGGRADHALANLHLLAALDGRGRAVDDDAWTWIVSPARPLALDLPPGATVSVLPFDARVEGIRYEGLEYHLQDATMEAGDPYGLSNAASARRQRIEVASGRLVVMAPRFVART